MIVYITCILSLHFNKDKLILYDKIEDECNNKITINESNDNKFLILLICIN